MQRKQNQVLNFKFLKWLTLVKRMLSYTLTYLRLILDIYLVPCLFYKFLCGIFASQKFYRLTCYSWEASLNYLNLLKYVPFYSQHMHELTIMLTFDQELARFTDINLNNVFVFHPLLHFKLIMKWLLNL